MTRLSAGRYQLLEEVGRGAVGVVYKAFDPLIGRTVAVKTMRLGEAESGMARPELLARFQTETRAAGLLTHPNIVVIYDAGESEGLFYITMEYVEGHSLQALLDKQQVFPVPRILKIMEQACSALHYAHEHSVVHRDIKPANIMLAGDETVKISDFGTAKILQLGTTQTGQIIGTPSYMSPEQVKGKLVDGRSDVFSLGVVLYELITGEKPFPGQNVTTVIYKIVNEEPVPPRRIDSAVHPGLSNVVVRALAKDPALRFQSCRELFEALKSHRNLTAPQESTMVMPRRSGTEQLPQPATETVPTVTATPVSAPPPATHVVARPSPPAKQEPAPMRWVQPEHEAPKKRSVGVWVLSLLLLTVIGAGGYLEWPKLSLLLQQIRPELFRRPAAPNQPPAAPAAQSSPATIPTAPVSAPATQGAAQTAAGPTAPPGPVRPSAGAIAEAPAAPPSAQSQVQDLIAGAGFAKQVRADVSGKKLVLTGKLTRGDHAELLSRLRKADLGLRVTDRIQIASVAPAETESERPRTSPGRGEIEVLTNQIGGLALLHSPKGDPDRECRTPCRFDDLAPGRYTMDITMDGFRAEKRIVELAAGSIHEVKVQFQALVTGLQVRSDPPGAVILLNGQAQRDPTPTTLYPPPGHYTITLRKPGYQESESSTDLGPGEFKTLTSALTPQVRGLGWVEVLTVPPGADILLDGKVTGQRSPTKLTVSTGAHELTLYLKGVGTARRSVTVQENMIVTVQADLRQR